ncbi:hypothetical protein D3C86_1486730 [compost metagenome]
MKPLAISSSARSTQSLAVALLPNLLEIMNSLIFWSNLPRKRAYSSCAYAAALTKSMSLLEFNSIVRRSGAVCETINEPLDRSFGISFQLLEEYSRPSKPACERITPMNCSNRSPRVAYVICSHFGLASRFRGISYCPVDVSGLFAGLKVAMSTLSPSLRSTSRT